MQNQLTIQKQNFLVRLVLLMALAKILLFMVRFLVLLMVKTPMETTSSIGVLRSVLSSHSDSESDITIREPKGSLFYF
mgnify:CR=1 FL=1